MKIVVCLKAIKTELIFSNENRNEKYLINPYDMKGLQSSINMKKDMNKSADCKIICLCMGTEDMKEVLVKALAMGADEAILLNSKKFAG